MDKKMYVSAVLIALTTPEAARATKINIAMHNGQATVDADMDGIQDIDEDVNSNGLVDPGETNADGEDTDDDRTIDGTELQLGLDPLDPNSAFTIQYQIWENHWIMSWPSLPGLTFDTEYLDPSFPFLGERLE